MREYIPAIATKRDAKKAVSASRLPDRKKDGR